MEPVVLNLNKWVRLFVQLHISTEIVVKDVVKDGSGNRVFHRIVVCIILAVLWLANFPL